jgi:hypothetical protein
MTLDEACAYVAKQVGWTPAQRAQHREDVRHALRAGNSVVEIAESYRFRVEAATQSFSRPLG